MSRSLFDPLADAYDAARPSYPDQLFDALEELTGPLAGRLVADVGAGTGISSRALLGRGARVVSCDLGPKMLARLRRRTPQAWAVLADGHRLPFRDAAADLVCYAQAWHWMDVGRASAEAVRVLRPGGALACWWNDVDADQAGWWQAEQARLEAWNPDYRRAYRDADHAAALAATGRFATVQVWETSWARELDLATYETWLRSKSYVAALGDRLEEFLAAQLTDLAAAFPDGRVIEPFRTKLVLART